MISLYHICPSKVGAYNSKGELKIQFFYVCTLLLVCSLTCVFGGGGGGGGGGERV